MQDDIRAALILDDDGNASTRLRRLLEELGFAVREMDETAAVIEILRQERTGPVVTFFALELPRNRMSGLDHAELLGALLRDTSLAARHDFIAVTESPDTVTLSMGRLLARLSVLLLPKPITLDTLREVVARAVPQPDGEAVGAV